MYEQVSHSLLNTILDDLKPEIGEHNLRHFYTRLGANFYAIYSLFHHLYGGREDFEQQLTRLVEVMARKHLERSEELKSLDVAREADHNWFLSQEWVGMALYSDGFAGDLKGLSDFLDAEWQCGVVIEQASIERELEVIHSQINDNDFEKSRECGNSMDFSKAVALALDDNLS